MSSALESLIASRIAAAFAPTPPDGVGRLARYVELLTHWNRRINLTSLDLDPPTEAAIDRLLVEPLLATKWVRPSDRRAVDVGSGGGSPAIPIAIACPGLEISMVESRGKKCAFLREVVRDLGLSNAKVLEGRFEDVAGSVGSVSVVTVRAVRLDAAFWQIANIICPDTARVLSLSSLDEGLPGGWVLLSGSGRTRVLEKAL